MTTLAAGAFAQVVLAAGASLTVNSGSGSAQVAPPASPGGGALVPIAQGSTIGPFSASSTINLQASASAPLVYTTNTNNSSNRSILDKLIAAAQGVDGSGIVAHPTITATFGITSNNVLPNDSTGTAIKTIPAGITGRNATASDVNVLNHPVLNSGGYHSGLFYSYASGLGAYSFPLVLGGSGATEFSFQFSGRFLWFLTTGNGFANGVLLDGKSVGTYTAPGGTSNAWVTVDFGSVVTGIVTFVGGIIGAMGYGFDGTVSNCGTNAPSVAVMGDSYLPYSCTVWGVSGGWIQHALARAGCREVFADGQGGTGYTANNNGSGFSALQRLPAMLSLNPSMLVTCMGINDPGTGFNQAQTNAAILSYYQQARASNPNMVLVAVGPWCPDETKAYTAAGTPQVTRANILAALQSVGGPWIFIDNLGGGWQTSAGTSATGNGVSWQTGQGSALTFTGSLLSGATSATLNAAFPLNTIVGANIVFASGEVRTATLTNGSAALTFAALSSAETANAGYYTTGNPGNCVNDVQSDGTHPTLIGRDMLADRLGKALRAALISMR